MILVSHLYRVRDTRIAPFRTSYRTLPTSYRTRSARAIRCTEGCDTSVSDSIQVRYKNHAMMFYLSLNCSIAVLAWKAFISIQYEIQNIFNKTVFGWCNFDNTTFTLGKFSKMLKWFNTKFAQAILSITNCLELIWFSCVVQFRLKVTFTKLVIYDSFFS